MIATSPKSLLRNGLYKSTVLRYTGFLIVFIGLLLIFPAALALFLDENCLIFLIPSAVVIPIGLIVLFLFREDKEGIRITSGVLMIGGTFLIVLLIGSAPYAVFGMSPIDSMFESLSGFTTTGFTVVSDFEAFPDSLFVWRSMTQWVGGISVLLIFMYMLPVMGLGSRGFFINEMSGSGTGNLSVRLKDSVGSFLKIYMALTLAQIILLVLLGMNLIDSLCITFSTVSTGGFATDPNSLTDYGWGIKASVMFFMFLGGTNFYLHYKGLYKKMYNAYVKNTEFRWTVGWYLFIAVLIGILMTFAGKAGVLNNFGESLFSVISAGTSTGFAVTDYADSGVWSAQLCMMLLLLVAFIGGMSGSTAGGVKMYRIVIIIKHVKNSIYKILHPMAVYDIKMDEHSVEESSVSGAFVTVILFALTVTITFICLMMTGILPSDSIGLAVSSVSNTGVVIGGHGSFYDLYMLNSSAKIIMMSAMFLGRLEIATALLLFMPGFWKEVRRNMKSDKSRGHSDSE